MLATHPNKNKLTIVLLPLAKEALLGYGNIPISVKELAKFCEKLKDKFGFHQFDLSLLNHDDLWYIRQLDLEDENLKTRLVTDIQK